MGKEQKDCYGGARPPRMKEIALALVLIIVWLAGSASGFRAELAWLGQMRETLGLSDSQKRLKLVGPVYRLIDNLSSVTPSDSTIYFYNPSRFDAAEYFHLQARYYLYPRKIINGRGNAPTPGIQDSDYLIVFITPETSASVLGKLERIPSLERVSGYSGIDSYWAVYKVGKGAPK